MRTSERASWSATVLPEGMVPKSRPHIDLAKISVGEEHNFPNILYFNVKRCFLILEKISPGTCGNYISLARHEKSINNPLTISKILP